MACKSCHPDGPQYRVSMLVKVEYNYLLAPTLLQERLLGGSVAVIQDPSVNIQMIFGPWHDRMVLGAKGKPLPSVVRAHLPRVLCVYLSLRLDGGRPHRRVWRLEGVPRHDSGCPELTQGIHC